MEFRMHRLDDCDERTLAVPPDQALPDVFVVGGNKLVGDFSKYSDLWLFVWELDWHRHLYVKWQY